MDDLILRQAAIDALCDEYCGGWKDCKHYPKCENLKAIQNLPPAQPEQKWIPVSEKLPRFAQRVLVSTVNYVYEAIYFDEDAGWSTYNVTFKDVEESEILAWMPLPATYRGKN